VRGTPNWSKYRRKRRASALLEKNLTYGVKNPD
jgi:hypothetical protein